ncbi:iron-sulfur cluster assembly scaffold protein [Candidatus Woesearchaeota archaeon]|nr:MAG: iron-sulfur cluster assembly scaffold protein [Candidatus Woesearchaeota archaeon]
MTLEYTKKVIEHFTNPKNVGEIKEPSGHAIEGSPACGDMVNIDIKVDDKGTIEDIKFKSYGCASNIATASVATELAKGKTINEAKNINWKDVEKELEGLPQVKVHCSILAVNTLKKAIENYEEKIGIKKEKKSIEEKVYDELGNIVNPNTGNIIVDDKIVKEVSINEKKIIIKIDLSDDDLYKNNISDEIKEHLEPLFEKIEIIFIKK